MRQKAIEIENKDAALAWIILGNKLRKEGKLDKASTYFQEAMQLNGNEPSAYVGRGKLFREQGHFKKALDDFNEADKLYHQSHPKLENHHKELQPLIKDTRKRMWQNILQPL